MDDITSDQSQIKRLVKANQRAGVDQRVIDLLVAYIKNLATPRTHVDFYDAHPNITDISSDARLSDAEKQTLLEFWQRQKNNGMDERIINLCIAYASNLLYHQVPVFFDTHDIASALEIEHKTLIYLSSNKYKSHYGYKVRILPKHTGGHRQITAPASKLKSIQRWILQEILSHVPPSDGAHGFRSGRSIVTNAAPHVGKHVLVKIDIKDFFPSISAHRVLNTFLKLGYTHQIALLLTRLTTFHNELPQGAPTSPVLANLVCLNLDRRLTGLAKKLGFTYTRYADDMTFSSNSEACVPNQLIRIALRIILDEGFSPAPQKLSVRRKSSRQVVTGIVVNSQLGVPREKRRRIRAAIHKIRYSPSQQYLQSNWKQIYGSLAYFHSINKRQAESLVKQFHKLSPPDAN
jgi:retron-type reverse transcriptase